MGGRVAVALMLRCRLNGRRVAVTMVLRCRLIGREGSCNHGAEVWTEWEERYLLPWC